MTNYCKKKNILECPIIDMIKCIMINILRFTL